jgi:ABC-type multidrug transport system ATPase subunit
MAIMDKGKVLFSGNTDDALNQIKGKVWERKVDKTELHEFQSNYKIISSKLVGGKPLIHAFSENELGNGFIKAEENLEDVFFAKLNELV